MRKRDGRKKGDRPEGRGRKEALSLTGSCDLKSIPETKERGGVSELR